MKTIEITQVEPGRTLRTISKHILDGTAAYKDLEYDLYWFIKPDDKPRIPFEFAIAKLQSIAMKKYAITCKCVADWMRIALKVQAEMTSDDLTQAFYQVSTAYYELKAIYETHQAAFTSGDLSAEKVLDRPFDEYAKQIDHIIATGLEIHRKTSEIRNLINKHRIESKPLHANHF